MRMRMRTRTRRTDRYYPGDAGEGRRQRRNRTRMQGIRSIFSFESFVLPQNDERALDYIEEHSAVDLNFVVSREKRFVLDLILAAQERDVGRFVDHAWNFDYVVELKPFQLRLLHDVYVAMKEPVHEEEEEEEEGDEDEEEEEDGAGSRDGRSDKGSDKGSDAGSTR